MRVFTSDRYLMRGTGGEWLYDEGALVRGKGVGSIFSRIFSSVVPYVMRGIDLGKRAIKSEVGKKITKTLKRTATEAGLNVVSDALQGKNVIDSAKRELKKAKSEMGQKLEKHLADRAKKKADSESSKGDEASDKHILPPPETFKTSEENKKADEPPQTESKPGAGGKRKRKRSKKPANSAIAPVKSHKEIIATLFQ